MTTKEREELIEQLIDAYEERINNMSVSDFRDEIAVSIGESDYSFEAAITALLDIEQEIFETMDDDELKEKAEYWLGKDS